MSRELDYFPPKPFNTTGWGSKALQYSPWKKTVYYDWPAHITLEVDLFDDAYQWCVNVTDWNCKYFRYIGKAKTAVEACEKAEKVGNQQLELLTPDWVKTALQNKWRSPFIQTNTTGYLGVEIKIIEMD